jgi:hypothetical protein
MTMTIAEFEKFKKSIDLLNQLRSIPLETIQFYLESEHGYIVQKPRTGEKKAE